MVKNSVAAGLGHLDMAMASLVEEAVEFALPDPLDFFSVMPKKSVAISGRLRSDTAHRCAGKEVTRLSVVVVELCLQVVGIHRRR